MAAEELAQERDAFRARRDFVKADEIRVRLRNQYGVDVLDTAIGYALQWHDNSPVRCGRG